MIPLSEMLAIFSLFLLSAMAMRGQDGALDRAFAKIPLEQWLKDKGAEARIGWSMRIFPARLTAHQRLAAVVSVDIDGVEFLKRNKPGQVVVFLEIRDGDNRAYRNYRVMTLPVGNNPSDAATVSFQQNTFVLPGEYSVAAAVYDRKSKEHSLKRMKLRVPELARDPLRECWRDLPAVEFAGLPDPPDRWYLPEITSRLHLPVKPERPVRVEVVVNESPTEMATAGRTGRVSRRNMGNLIPALKVLSQMEIGNGSMNVTLLDLERRKVSFTQEEVGTLDWTRLRAALLANDPDQIDVHALENHEQNAQFFVSEVRKRLESSESNGDVPLGLSAEPARVLIVLSGPMAFPKGQDLRPIEATPEPGSRVFYIRYNPPISAPGGLTLGGFSGRRGGGPPPNAGVGVRGVLTQDSLGSTLKPLAPRLFDVTTPAEFRNALAAIMSEISQLK